MVWVCSLCQTFLKCKVAKRATHSFSSGKKSHILWWITFAKMKNCWLLSNNFFFERVKNRCNNFTAYFSKILNKHSKIDGKVTKTTIYIFCSAFNFSFWNRICVALSLRYFWDLFKNAELKMRVETILKESCNFQKADEVICCIHFSSTAVGKING